MKKYFLLFLMIFYLVTFPIFSFAPLESSALFQERAGIKAPPFLTGFAEKELKLPETPEEIKSFLTKFLELLPKALKESWQEVLKIFKKIYQIFKEIWAKFFKATFDKILSFLKKEIQEKRAIFKEELKKEIKELKEEILRFFKKIFERLRK